MVLEGTYITQGLKEQPLIIVKENLKRKKAT